MLRELSWAADAKERAEWGRLADGVYGLTAAARAAFGGPAFDPLDLIPERYRPPKPPEKPVDPDENRRAAAQAIGFLQGLMGT